MKQYILKRVLTGILAVVVVLVLNFFVIHAAPGDPIRILAGRDNPSEEMIVELQKKYGLDQPIYLQLVSYLKNVIQGDFGQSILYNEPVMSLIGHTMGPSLLLALSGAILALIIGTLLGLYASRHQGSKIDTFFSGLAYLFNAMPSFWLGIMLIMIFASWLKILPTSGMLDLRANYTGLPYYIDILKHLILPVATLSLIQIPTYFKLAQTTVLQVTSEDFITTFKATGMSEKKIFYKYVLKNALLPTITVFGISLAYIVTGSALVETVFAWPGTGRLMLDAIMRRDYPLLMGIYLIMSISIAVMMVITDIVYAFIDPRIRYK
ncbi:ABC transporter permease [Cytobacillus dafuensis]|uniref:ABC transporter permease n=1 Tax=Cytobacillus dafuensis TaxID=1742359 RepID=A0A5B8ZA38_CYTDA|nr:ABC transporter permease [Cytobacillus dafuensis]QED49113.1 ABC transporter permease [Cytobacillus dafuensis]